MKTTNPKTMLKALCLMAVVALAAMPVKAKSLLDLQIAQANEVYDSDYVTSIATIPGTGDEQAALKLFYVGTATEAVVTINTTGLTFYAPYNVADTAVGSSGQFAFATYATYGALCDAINKTANYQCRLEDGRRSDAVDTLFATTAVSGQRNLKANGGFQVAISSGSGANAATVGTTYVGIGINPPAGTRVILRKCTFFGAGSGYVKFTVTGVKRNAENAPDGVTRDDSTIVWKSTSAVSTATTISFDSSGVGGLSFAAAEQGVSGPATGLPAGQSTVQTTPPNTKGRVVIRLESDGTTQQLSTGYLYCQWTDR